MVLSVNYQLFAPLRLDVTFEIRGFTALLGRSGAGKTSLLRALAGLLPATGTPWAGLPPEARPIGYMPQGAAIFPHLTVLQNAAFALRGPNRVSIAQKLLDDLGVGHLAARSGAKISGGEASRVALARALARQPDLLLLDEPTAALDAATRDAVLMQLIDITGRKKIPSLAATHDPAIAGQADWLVLLSEGRIIRQGAPRVVFANPETIAAARLLGYRNFWMRDGVTRAIRDEDIEITETGIAAIIIAVRDHGADLRITCMIPEPISILHRNGDAASFHIGQTINLTFPSDKCRILTDDH